MAPCTGLLAVLPLWKGHTSAQALEARVSMQVFEGGHHDFRLERAILDGFVEPDEGFVENHAALSFHYIDCDTAFTSPSADRLERFARRAVTGALVLALVGLGVFTHGFTSLPSTYTMTGESMRPAVGRGDWFLVRPLSGLPRPGELVIIEHWIDDTLYHVLRRTVALPGDTLEMRAGLLVVNGRPTPWPSRVIVPQADRTLDGPISGTIYNWGPIALGPDSVFVLSDTRDMIGWPDSRFFGAIPTDRIVARFSVRLWRGPPPTGP